MPTPAACGLRIAHCEHPIDDTGAWCPGKPWPPHYEPKHRNLADYRPEVDWVNDVTPRPGRHRLDCPTRLADEIHPPRPWLRLGWRDDHKSEGGRGNAGIAAACALVAGLTGASATNALSFQFDQLVRQPVLIAKKSED